mmetsp:Transcript_11959/g.35813  ORF Transcript_11959/g.35813 Transcript_11959/m.35813 type:complete len:308 (-) Transcript_11959:1743-2666(-)
MLGWVPSMPLPSPMPPMPPPPPPLMPMPPPLIDMFMGMLMPPPIPMPPPFILPMPFMPCCMPMGCMPMAGIGMLPMPMDMPPFMAPMPPPIIPIPPFIMPMPPIPMPIWPMPIPPMAMPPIPMIMPGRKPIMPALPGMDMAPIPLPMAPPMPPPMPPRTPKLARLPTGMPISLNTMALPSGLIGPPAMPSGRLPIMGFPPASGWARGTLGGRGGGTGRATPFFFAMSSNRFSIFRPRSAGSSCPSLAIRTGLSSFRGLLPREAVSLNSRSSTRFHSTPKMVPTAALPSHPSGLPRTPPTGVVMRAYP